VKNNPQIDSQIDSMIRGLPGEDLIRKGIQDLQSNQTQTSEALLMRIASKRLTQAGLAVFQSIKPSDQTAESLLYQRLVENSPQTAYRDYQSQKRRLDSFIRCLETRQQEVDGGHYKS
jgi:hypothetical protein